MSSGERLPGWRYVPHRNRQMGEAQHRARNSGMGHEDVHPVRQVRDGVPAFGDPDQTLTSVQNAGRWTGRI